MNNNLKPYKKGETGNINGRPKGKSIKRILSELLNKKIEIENFLTKNTERRTIKEILVIKLLYLAIEKDSIKAIENLFNLIDVHSEEQRENDSEYKQIQLEIQRILLEYNKSYKDDI